MPPSGWSAPSISWSTWGDDHAVLAEIARVTAPGARLIISAPLHANRWIPFDDLVGHCRRYDPDVFFAILERNGFTIEESAGYGMQPKSSRLLDFGMRFLAWRPREGMWWYNNIFMPIGLMFQSELKFAREQTIHATSTRCC